MMVYMEVTRDRYEIPICFAESMGELARRCHVDVSTISHALRNVREGKSPKSKYIEVEITTEDTEERNEEQ